jgi:DNA-binding transcriptional regulator YiaG
MEKDGKNTMKDNIITETVAALRLSNQKLADLLGVPKAHVENWRYKGVNVPPGVLVNICRLLIDRLNGISRIQEVTSRAVQRQEESEKPRRRVRA